jgi:hypothetical protein
MKNLILILVFLLSACSEKPDVEGTYYNDFSHTSYTFKDGNVSISRNGGAVDKSQYTVDGDVIKIHGFPFTKFEDGSEDLNCGSAHGRLVKK